MQPTFSNSQILSIFPQHPVGGTPYSPPPYPPTAMAWAQQGLLANRWPSPAVAARPTLPTGLWGNSGVQPEAQGRHPGVMNGGITPHTPALNVSGNPAHIHPPNTGPDLLQWMKCWIYVDFSPHVSEFICCFSYISVSFMNYCFNLTRFKSKCVNPCHVTIDVILGKVFQTLCSSVARLQAQNVKKIISLWFLLSVFPNGKQSVIKVHVCVCAGNSSLLLSPRVAKLQSISSFAEFAVMLLFARSDWILFQFWKCSQLSTNKTSLPAKMVRDYSLTTIFQYLTTRGIEEEQVLFNWR